MPRPPKCRVVTAPPGTAYFKPQGVPMRQLTEVYLPLEGLEALRLADHQGLKHEDAARQMQISRQTFGRILAKARQTVAEALVRGMALRIEGGENVILAHEQTAPQAAKASRKCARAADAGTETRSGNRVRKGDIMGKIAISSEGPSLDEAVDPRFGRAAGFLIIDPDSETFEYIDNGASQTMAQGAGIQAAEIVARSGVKAVLTGYVGPKAFKTLEVAGIEIAQDMDNMTAREALEKYKRGDFTIAQQPNRAGHGS